MNRHRNALGNRGAWINSGAQGLGRPLMAIAATRSWSKVPEKKPEKNPEEDSSPVERRARGHALELDESHPMYTPALTDEDLAMVSSQEDMDEASDVLIHFAACRILPDTSRAMWQ
jgi:hypothetical protein